MSSFTGALILSDNNDGETFTVYVTFRYYVGEENSRTYRDVLTGFVTNLASKPSFMRRTGRYNRAAVLHDALYDQPHVIDKVGDKLLVRTLNRKECDGIFLEAMRATMPVIGEGWRVKLKNAGSQITAYTYYRFVRAFGWRYWAHG